MDMKSKILRVLVADKLFVHVCVCVSVLSRCLKEEESAEGTKNFRLPPMRWECLWPSVAMWGIIDNSMALLASTHTHISLTHTPKCSLPHCYIKLAGARPRTPHTHSA